MGWSTEVKSVASTVNSSTTLLTSGSTFTGTAEHNDHPSVMVAVKTDQNGTLYCDFSVDGTNWDSTLSFTYDTTKINPLHILEKGPRYYRTRFTNSSGSDQTYLRLQTSFGTFNKLTSAFNSTFAQTYDAIAVRPSSYFTEVVEGVRQGHQSWGKFGYKDGVSDSTGSVIWPYTTDTYTPLPTEQKVEIASSSTNDDGSPVGTGARTVTIYGISNGALAQETLTLDGTTYVQSTNTYTGINRVKVITAGTSGYNEGNLTVRGVTDTSAIPAYVAAQAGVTEQMIFHIPDDKDAYIHKVVLTGGKLGAKTADFVCHGYQVINGVRLDLFQAFVSGSNHFALDFTIPVRMAAGSYWYITAQADITGGFLSCRVDQILIDN